MAADTPTTPLAAELTGPPPSPPLELSNFWFDWPRSSPPAFGPPGAFPPPRPFEEAEPQAPAPLLGGGALPQAPVPLLWTEEEGGGPQPEVPFEIAEVSPGRGAPPLSPPPGGSFQPWRGWT